jgi:hypothetical protein
MKGEMVYRCQRCGLVVREPGEHYGIGTVLCLGWPRGEFQEVELFSAIEAELGPPRTIQALAKRTRIDSRSLKPILDDLVKGGRAAKSGAGAGTKYGRPDKVEQ